MATGIQTSVQRGRRSGIVSNKTHYSTVDWLASFWRTATTKKKLTILAVLSLLITITLGAAFTIKSREYVDLYPSKMGKENVREISMLLAAREIAHAISPTQDSILLAPEDVARARQEAARSSLPRDERAPEVPERMIDTAEARQDVRLRKLEAEIVVTLRQLDFVLDAKVKLAVPSKTFFQDEAKKTKASVFLKLAEGYRMTADNTAALASLVSASVPDLAPENVTILNEQGRELSAEPEAGEMEMGLESTRENALQRKLQHALSMVYGDRAHATVNVSMDFSQEDTKRHTPGGAADGGVVLDSYQRFYESLEGQGDEKDKKDYALKKEAGNYVYSTYDVHTVRQHPKVARITASVVFDGASPDEKASIEQIVRGTLGIDESRGDEVFVVGTPWNRPLAADWPTESGLESKDRDKPFPMVLLGMGLGILGSFLCGLLVLVAKRPQAPNMALGLDHGAAGVQGIVTASQSKLGDAPQAVTGCQPGLTDLENLVALRPQSAAEILRSTWLS